jgi:hypothetical protein
VRADLDYEFAVLRLGLLVGGLALFVLGWRAQRAGEGPAQRRLRLALLGILAATAFGSYFYFWRFARLHVADTFHYYVGAKYFPELGYYGLYDCTLQALDDAGRVDLAALPHVRNLGTMALEPPRRALARGPGCKQAFSPERWRRFAADVRWFQGRTTADVWAHVLEDHGYHPSPVWTLFGRPLASAIPLKGVGTRLLARVDHVLVLGAFLFVGWSVGWETACLAAIVWGTGFLWRYSWIGDAFLRHLWLASSLVGLACLQRRRHAGAAVFLTTAALLRVFPGVFWIGCAGHALRELLRTRVVTPAMRRFVAASALTAAVLVAASVVVSGRGLTVWPEFVDKISRFAEHGAVNKMGLGVVAQALERELGGRDGATGAAGGSGGLGAALQAGRLLVVALGLLGFWRALAHAEDWEAAALGMTLVPLLTDPTNYYFSLVLAALFLALRRPRIGVVLFLACIAWSANGLIFYRQDVEFVGASLVALALSFAILREMTRPTLPARGGGHAEELRAAAREEAPVAAPHAPGRPHETALRDVRLVIHEEPLALRVGAVEPRRHVEVRGAEGRVRVRLRRRGPGQRVEQQQQPPRVHEGILERGARSEAVPLPPDGLARARLLVEALRVDRARLEVLPEWEGRAPLGLVQLVPVAQPLGRRELGRARHVVLEPRAMGRGAHDGLQDRPPGLPHAHAERLAAAALVERRDLHVHGLEARHPEEVGRERGGALDARLAAGRAQRDRRDVAAVRPPDLPVSREEGAVAARLALDARVRVEVTHRATRRPARGRSTPLRASARPPGSRRARSPRGSRRRRARAARG